MKSCEPDYEAITSITDNSLKSCSIVSSDLNLFEGQLSDYWAQEAIGADLLREELNTRNPVDKKLIELFDVHNQNAHDIAVRNLVSGDGKQSILPELDSKINISQTKYSSQLLATANHLLNTADSQCESIANNDSTTDSNSGAGGSNEGTTTSSPRSPSSQQPPNSNSGGSQTRSNPPSTPSPQHPPTNTRLSSTTGTLNLHLSIIAIIILF